MSAPICTICIFIQLQKIFTQSPFDKHAYISTICSRLLPAYSIARKIILMYNSGMGEVLLDALLDSLKILPFLFLVYVLIEILETKTSAKLKSGRALRGGFAPLLGAGIGLVPQCGFSVMATNLFAKGYLSVGTLLAVYISTSDEAIPILLANPAGWSKLWPLTIRQCR